MAPNKKKDDEDKKKQEQSGDDSFTGTIFKAVDRTLHFLPTAGGLVFILILFTLLGAFIFYTIESKHEKQILKISRLTHNKLRMFMANEFLNASKRFGKDNEAFLQRSLLLLQEYDRMREQSGAVVPALWTNFLDAIFYSATVYTTIGYGNAYPRTTEGKVFTMIYALIGIPLCLIVVAELGKSLTRGIKSLYRQIKTSLDDTSFPINEEFDFSILFAIALAIVYLLVGAVIYHLIEPSWSIFDSFYFLFISGSTIGFGDMVPMQSRWFFLAGFIHTLGVLTVVSAMVAIFQARFDDAVIASRRYLRNQANRKGAKHVKKDRTKPTEEEVADIYGRAVNPNWINLNCDTAGDDSGVVRKRQVAPQVDNSFAKHHGTADEYELEVARIYGREPNSWKGKGVPPLEPAGTPKPSPVPEAAAPQQAKQVMTSSMVDALIKSVMAAESSHSPSPEDTEVSNLLLCVSSTSSLAPAVSSSAAKQSTSSVTSVAEEPSAQPNKLLLSPKAAARSSASSINNNEAAAAAADSKDALHQNSNLRPLVTQTNSTPGVPQQPQLSPNAIKLQRISNLAQRCKKEPTPPTAIVRPPSLSGDSALQGPAVPIVSLLQIGTNSAFTPIISRDSSTPSSEQVSPRSQPATTSTPPRPDSTGITADPQAIASPRSVRATYRSEQSPSSATGIQGSNGRSSATATMPSYATLLADSRTPLSSRTSAFSAIPRDPGANNNNKSRVNSSVPPSSSSSSYMSQSIMAPSPHRRDEFTRSGESPPRYGVRRTSAGSLRNYPTSSTSSSVKTKDVPLIVSPSDRERLPQLSSQILMDAIEFGASIGRSRACRSVSSSPTPISASSYLPTPFSTSMTTASSNWPSNSYANSTRLMTPSSSHHFPSTIPRPSPVNAASLGRNGPMFGTDYRSDLGSTSSSSSSTIPNRSYRASSMTRHNNQL